MKTIFAVLIFFATISLYAQDNDKWFHLEGVSNPEYKIYLNETNMDYVPGETISGNLKYVYSSDSLLSYSISNVKFLVSKDAYQILSTRNYFINKNGRKTEQFSKSINPSSLPLIPGSEMSVIYQGVYIQAVSNYRPKSK